MRTRSSSDKRRVYLACRGVFNGQNALIRKRKKVREFLEIRQATLKPIINDYGIDRVADIALVLLNSQVFQSEAKAKNLFPELFQSTPNVRHFESEQDAERNKTSDSKDTIIISESDERGHDQENNDNDKAEIEETKVSSIFSTYLPYKVQHTILTTVQRQLEQCCFEFAAKWLSPFLKARKWTCSEAVELTEWTRTLPKQCEKVPDAINNTSGCSLEVVFISTNMLRHTAVHRLPASIQEICEMIRFASRLARTLQDLPRAAQLDGLQLAIEDRLEDMDMNKNSLKNRLEEQLHAIHQQRVELDRKEEEAIAAIFKEDQEKMLFLASSLEASCREILQIGDMGQTITHPVLMETDEKNIDDISSS